MACALSLVRSPGLAAAVLNGYIAADQGPCLRNSWIEMNENGTLMVDVPSLDALVSDPTKAGNLTPDVAQRLLCGLAAVLPLIIVAATKVTTACDRPPATEKWLTVEETANQFGLSRQWLYRHKRQLPHSQPSRKVLLFHEEKLRRWFTAQKTCR